MQLNLMFFVFLFLGIFLLFSFYFISLRRKLNKDKHFTFTDYVSYAEGVFSFFLFVVFLFNIFKRHEFLTALAKLSFFKVFSYLFLLLAEIAVLYAVIIYVIKKTFKFLKVNKKEDLTYKKVFIAIFISSVIVYIIYLLIVFVFGLIMSTFINL